MFFARKSLFLEGLFFLSVSKGSFYDLFYDNNSNIIVKVVSLCVM